MDDIVKTSLPLVWPCDWDVSESGVCYVEDWEPHDALCPGILAAWHGGDSQVDPRRDVENRASGGLPDIPEYLHTVELLCQPVEAQEHLLEQEVHFYHVWLTVYLFLYIL